MTALPLAGIKVVEIAQNLAGPFAGEILARLGADVVKVERPDGGDDARGWGPPFLADLSPVFHAANTNKRSITLDLRDPAAVAWLIEYVEGADVLVQNLRPGVIGELGLGPETLLAKNPRLVYCSLWTFGTSGPLRLRPGYEPMVQAFAGLMMVNGEEGGPPMRMGTSVLDSGTGMWAAIGVLAALVERQRTGRGSIVDTSLFETGLGWLANHFASYRISGNPPLRHRTGSSRLVVFQGFETKDGPVIIAAANDRLFETGLGWLANHFASYRISGNPPLRHRTGSSRLVVFQGFETKNGPVIIAAANDRLFAKLAVALGRPDWATDPRFTTNALRQEHKAALVPEIETIMLTRTKGEWVDLLEEAGVPCAPIHTFLEVLAHPQTAATGMIQKVPELDLELMGLPISFDGERPPLRGRAPRLGEHNQEIRGGGTP